MTYRELAQSWGWQRPCCFALGVSLSTVALEHLVRALSSR
jgi:hypothetical protein